MVNNHLQSDVDAAQAALQPLQSRLTALTAERADKQSIVDTATLETDPSHVLAAELRIRLLDRAIPEARQHVERAGLTLHHAASAQAQREREIKVFKDRLAILEDVTHPETQMLKVYDWILMKKSIQQTLARLIGEQEEVLV